MKPLREQIASSDPAVARAAALVAAMRPLDPNRIRRPPAPIEARTRRAGLHTRVVFVVPALILASAVAGAATRPGTGWLRALGAWARVTQPGSPAPTLAPAPRTTAAETTSRPPAPALPDVPPVVTAAPSSPPRATAPPVRAASKSTRTTAVDAADESALVVEAVRALRRDHDPRRARELAEEALHRFPHGAQSEEATAVAMEGASGDGDTAAARRWAERYLASFGAGRFADRARDVLSAASR
jgi:hypothetical protein